MYTLGTDIFLRTSRFMQEIYTYKCICWRKLYLCVLHTYMHTFPTGKQSISEEMNNDNNLN